MCGIAGYTSNNNFPANSLMQSLSHRGPDDCGEYRCAVNGQSVYLGHRRLSIIDLTACGHQPMSTPDESIYIIYNGEIYNFESLKHKHLKEYEFRSRTDTEVILYLYHKFGIEFIKLLNGDFAIAILDKKNAKFYLIRDRLGVKPLYYYWKNQQLYFASELKALLKSGLRVNLSNKQLQRYFALKYVPGDDTLFKNVHRLKPGNYLEYDFYKKEILIKPYWQLQKNSAYDQFSYEEAKITLDQLLGDATRIRLMADVPVGNFFSGGLDSSAIAYYIKDNQQITHYSARKNQADIIKEGTTSDFEYAQRLAKEFNLNMVPIDIAGDEANLELIRKTIYYSDDLIADGSQIPSYLITEQASKTSKVMLSGMGADELFLGYAGHLLTLMSLGFEKLPHLLSLIFSRRLSKISQGKGHFKAYRRYLHKIGKYYEYPDYKYGIFTIVGDLENSLSVYQQEREDVIDFISGYFNNGNDPFENITRFEIDNFLVKNLHYLDRMCMANSVEGRVPFLDHRLVEFAFSIPREWKLSNTGQSKKILKDTIKPYLPDYIIRRRKAGFGMPLRSIFSDINKVNQLLDRNFFSNFDHFSITDINRIINNHISGREDNSALIYALISFQEWYKLFVEN